MRRSHRRTEGLPTPLGNAQAEGQTLRDGVPFPPGQPARLGDRIAKEATQLIRGRSVNYAGSSTVRFPLTCVTTASSKSIFCRKALEGARGPQRRNLSYFSMSPSGTCLLCGHLGSGTCQGAPSAPLTPVTPPRGWASFHLCARLRAHRPYRL